MSGITWHTIVAAHPNTTMSSATVTCNLHDLASHFVTCTAKKTQMHNVMVLVELTSCE